MNQNLLAVISKVAAHFSKPGVRFGIETSTNTCCYRNRDGDMCAIGCLITDEMATKLADIPVMADNDSANRYIVIWSVQQSIESMLWNKKWKEFLGEFVKGLGCDNQDIFGLIELQQLHDGMSMHYTAKDFADALWSAIKNESHPVSNRLASYDALRAELHA